MQFKKPPVKNKPYMPTLTPDKPGAKKPVVIKKPVAKQPVAKGPYMPRLTPDKPGAKKPVISKRK
jgi:hypothetical protein